MRWSDCRNNPELISTIFSWSALARVTAALFRRDVLNALVIVPWTCTGAPLVAGIWGAATPASVSDRARG